MPYTYHQGIFHHYESGELLPEWLDDEEEEEWLNRSGFCFLPYLRLGDPDEAIAMKIYHARDETRETETKWLVEIDDGHTYTFYIVIIGFLSYLQFIRDYGPVFSFSKMEADIKRLIRTLETAR